MPPKSGAFYLVLRGRWECLPWQISGTPLDGRRGSLLLWLLWAVSHLWCSGGLAAKHERKQRQNVWWLGGRQLPGFGGASMRRTTNL
jgi:hypothetical protein